MELASTRFRGNATRVDDDCVVPAIQHTQDANEIWLWLDGNNTSADPAEDVHAVAHMRTDVESQVSGSQELLVERFEPSAAPDWPVIGSERTSDPGGPADHVGLPWHCGQSLKAITSPSNTTRHGRVYLRGCAPNPPLSNAA